MTERVETLYRRYGAIMYARCKRILGDPALAEDATQEVFIRSMGHVGRLEDDTEAIRWLYRVTTNYCLNVLRDRKRRREILDQMPEFDLSDPEKVLGDELAVRGLLREIPKKIAEPAALHYLVGLDQGAVARALGVSRRTVVNRLEEFRRRAKKSLLRGEGALS